MRCIAPEKDKANNCPTCDYTISFNFFRKNYYKILTKELAEQGENYQSDKDFWSFETLLEDYRTLSELEEVAGIDTEEKAGGFNPRWNVRASTAIRIIREERQKIRREDAYKREQAAEDERRERESLRGRR